MYSFKKAERLKSRKTIDKLFTEGNTITEYPVKLVWIQPAFYKQNIPVQAAFSVSKRKHNKAVVRNRIKRLMREAYRLNKNGLYIYLKENNKNLALMFIYSGDKLPRYFEVEDKIIMILDRLPHVINEKSK